MENNPILFEEDKLGTNQLNISWKNIQNNLLYFRSKLQANTKLMLMVKTSAYGTTAVGISQLVEKNQLADYLAVAYLEEGIELRKVGIKLPIVILNPQATDWQLMVQHCLEPEIYNMELLKSFINFLSAQTDSTFIQYPFHLELNTGMNRLGIEPSSIDELSLFLKTNKVGKVKSVMTHLSSTALKEEDEYSDIHQLQ